MPCRRLGLLSSAQAWAERSKRGLSTIPAVVQMGLIQIVGERVLSGLTSIADDGGEEPRMGLARAFSPELGTHAGDLHVSHFRSLGETGRISMRILAVSLSVLLTLPANADPTGQGRWYAYAGASLFEDVEYVIIPADVGRGLGLKLGIGRRFNRAFAIEGMIDLPRAADPEDHAIEYSKWWTDTGWILQSFEMNTTGARFLTLAAAFEIPLNRVGRTSLVAKIGLGVVQFDWKGTLELVAPHQNNRERTTDIGDSGTSVPVVLSAGGKFAIDATGKNEIQILATKHYDIIDEYSPLSLGISLQHNF